MGMEIRSFVVGPIDVNCYVVQDTETKQGMVIDPGGKGDVIWQYIQQASLDIQLIVNTHAHGDHIGAVDFLRERSGAGFYIHEADADMLLDAKKNLSAFMGFTLVTRPADVLLHDGDVVKVGQLSFRVIHTPGHSAGGICLYGEKVLFSGDSLFAESIGRCDFPGASSEQLIQALQEKIMVLPEDTRVYPGHGPATTVGWEHAHNPYLQDSAI